MFEIHGIIWMLWIYHSIVNTSMCFKDCLSDCINLSSYKNVNADLEYYANFKSFKLQPLLINLPMSLKVITLFVHGFYSIIKVSLAFLFLSKNVCSDISQIIRTNKTSLYYWMLGWGCEHYRQIGGLNMRRQYRIQKGFYKPKTLFKYKSNVHYSYN